MKKILTDCKTGRKFSILLENQNLPAFGEDGIEYFVFKSNLTSWGGEPRDDCFVVDLNEGIAIKAVTHPAFGIEEPLEYIFDKESFDSANTIEEYAEMIREKGLIK